MTSRLAKETLVGQYLPFEGVSELPEGAIDQGLNLMRKSLLGSWTPRRGYTLLNTVPIAAEVSKLFHYRNIGYKDGHIFVQGNGVLHGFEERTEGLLAEDGLDLLTEEGLFLDGTFEGELLDQRGELSVVYDSVGTVPGFSCVIGEEFIYCDGEVLLTYGGLRPWCDGFVVYNGALGTFIDYTAEVTNVNEEEYADVGFATSHLTEYYVGMRERGGLIKLKLRDIEISQTAELIVEAFRDGEWEVVTATDGTENVGFSHTQDGEISWSASDEDEMTVIEGRQLYWYRFSYGTANADAHIVECRVERAIQPMTNKWDGEYEYVKGAMAFDAALGEFTDELGSLTDGSDSTYVEVGTFTESDYLYVKLSYPLLGLGIKVVADKPNAASTGEIKSIEFMSYKGWWEIEDFVDGTTQRYSDGTLRRSGTVWVREHRPELGTFQSDATPGYWYRLQFENLSSHTQISELLYAPMPEELDTFQGCLEFRGRLVLWGGTKYPNRLVYSDYLKPDQLGKLEEHYTVPFGGEGVIKSCGKIGSRLAVFKSPGVFLVESDFFTISRALSDIGIGGPHTLCAVEIGDNSLKEEEYVTTLMWQDQDGVYKLTEDGHIRKVSEQVRSYFDNYSEHYIGKNAIDRLQAIYERTTDTYRLFLPDYTLCYSVRSMEWLPVWGYPLRPVTSIGFFLEDGEYVCLSGSREGFVLHMERVISDRWDDNTELAIQHSLRTRPILLANEEVPAIIGALRGLWVEVKADSGDFSVNLYVNRSRTPITVVKPAVPNLDDEGNEINLLYFSLSEEQVYCFQVACVAIELNQRLEVYSINYFVDQLRTF